MFFTILMTFLALSIPGHSEGLEKARKGFWEDQPKWIKKAEKNREILVYVSESEEKTQVKLLSLQAMGIMNVPPEEAVQRSVRYENLKKLSSIVTDLRHDAKNNKLNIKTKSFGYTAEFDIKTSVKRDSESTWIHWNVVGGYFKGMQLHFELKGFGDRKTRIALYGEHRYKDLGIPRFFIEFGMEVIMQQSAHRLRQIIEEEFNND
tara:strand:- start:44567 stop:45184 length:618 start_codon:yes stop_codon:yes gene_type:complete